MHVSNRLGGELKNCSYILGNSPFIVLEVLVDRNAAFSAE
jgi:hypothetical protein